MKKKLGIVIPAYNEEKRLPGTLKNLRQFLALKGNAWDVRQILIVNDGSRDHTASVIAEARTGWPELHSLQFQKNMGKGAAVFAGLEAFHRLRENGSVDAPVDYILVADADEATPWSELLTAHSAAEKNPECFLIFGSRRHPESDILSRQQWWREKLGRIFNLLLRVVSGVPFKDTQCGFKLFKNDERLIQILRQWTVARFAWDAEVLLNCLATKLSCQELAIQWRHVEESRVHPIKDGLQMAAELLRIRVRRWLRPWQPQFQADQFSERVNSQVLSRFTVMTDADRLNLKS